MGVNNEIGVMGKIDTLQKQMAGGKGGGAKKKGGMKEAADSAEQIRKWQDHMWPLEELEKNLQTSRVKGLDTVQAAEVFKTAGENTLTERGKVPAYVVFLHEQTGFFSLLLWLGAALCFIAYGLGVHQIGRASCRERV